MDYSRHGRACHHHPPTRSNFLTTAQIPVTCPLVPLPLEPLAARVNPRIANLRIFQKSLRPSLSSSLQGRHRLHHLMGTTFSNRRQLPAGNLPAYSRRPFPACGAEMTLLPYLNHPARVSLPSHRQNRPRHSKLLLARLQKHSRQKGTEVPKLRLDRCPTARLSCELRTVGEPLLARSRPFQLPT
jgi:hypothetical protein